MLMSYGKQIGRGNIPAEIREFAKEHAEKGVTLLAAQLMPRDSRWGAGYIPPVTMSEHHIERNRIIETLGAYKQDGRIIVYTFELYKLKTLLTRKYCLGGTGSEAYKHILYITLYLKYRR